MWIERPISMQGLLYPTILPSSHADHANQTNAARKGASASLFALQACANAGTSAASFPHMSVPGPLHCTPARNFFDGRRNLARQPSSYLKIAHLSWRPSCCVSECCERLRSPLLLYLDATKTQYRSTAGSTVMSFHSLTPESCCTGQICSCPGWRSHSASHLLQLQLLLRLPPPVPPQLPLLLQLHLSPW